MSGFTVDWFSRRSGFFTETLGKNKLTRCLEIGCFEGRSAVWMVQNLLNAEGHLYCLDTWKGGPKGTDMVAVENRFLNNTKPFSSQITVLKGTSFEGLVGLLAKEQETFDFIYIDGSHTAWDVLADCVLAWRLLKVGGIMAMDDYMWGKDTLGDRSPFPAVNAFLETHGRFLNVLHKDYQVWVKKKNDDQDD